MTSRRPYDTQPGTTRHEPYKAWIPAPDPDSDYPRQRKKTTTSKKQPVDPRVSADQTRHHTSGYRSDSYLTSATPASSYHNVQSTSRSASRSAMPANHGSQPSSTLQPSSSGHAQYDQMYSRSHSVRPQQPYDTRLDMSNTTALPRSRSFAKCSATEDSGKRTATPEVWIPPSAEMPPTSKKYKRDERQREEYRNRPKQKSDGHAERDHDGRGDTQRAREKEKRKERLRESEREPVIPSERRNTIKAPASTRYYYVPESKTEDPESSDSALKNRVAVSSSRRYRRTDKAVSSTSTVRGHDSEASKSRPISTKHGITSSSTDHQPLIRHTNAETTSTLWSSGTPMSERPFHTSNTTRTETSTSAPDHLDNQCPPTPKVMPIYLPQKEIKTQGSHQNRTSHDFAQSGQAGSDTEHRAEPRHRRNSSSSRQHIRVPAGVSLQRSENNDLSSMSRSSTRQEVVTNDFEPNSKQKEVEVQSWSRIRGSSATSKPLVTTLEPPLAAPAGFYTSLPTEGLKHEHTTPQFVSLRAAQGPSPPHISDTLNKAATLSTAGGSLATPPTIPTKPYSTDRTRVHDTPREITSSSPTSNIPEPPVQLNPTAMSSQLASTTPKHAITSRSLPDTMTASADSFRPVETTTQAQLAPVCVPLVSPQASSKGVAVDFCLSPALTRDNASTSANDVCISASTNRQVTAHGGYSSQAVPLQPLVLQSTSHDSDPIQSPSEPPLPSSITPASTNMSERPVTPCNPFPTGSSQAALQRLPSPSGVQLGIPVTEIPLVVPPFGRSQKTSEARQELAAKALPPKPNLHGVQSQDQMKIAPETTPSVTVSSKSNLLSPMASQSSAKQPNTKRKKVSFATLVDERYPEQTSVLANASFSNTEPIQTNSAPQTASLTANASKQSTEQSRLEEVQSTTPEVATFTEILPKKTSPHARLDNLHSRESSRPQAASVSSGAKSKQDVIESPTLPSLYPPKSQLQAQSDTSRLLSESSPRPLQPCKRDTATTSSQIQPAITKLDEARSPRPPVGTLKIYELGSTQEPIRAYFETSVPTATPALEHPSSKHCGQSHNLDTRIPPQKPLAQVISNATPAAAPRNESQFPKPEVVRPSVQTNIGSNRSPNKADIGCRNTSVSTALAKNTREQSTLNEDQGPCAPSEEQQCLASRTVLSNVNGLGSDEDASDGHADHDPDRDVKLSDPRSPSSANLPHLLRDAPSRFPLDEDSLQGRSQSTQPHPPGQNESTECRMHKMSTYRPTLVQRSIPARTSGISPLADHSAQRRDVHSADQSHTSWDRPSTAAPTRSAAVTPAPAHGHMPQTMHSTGSRKDSAPSLPPMTVAPAAQPVATRGNISSPSPSFNRIEQANATPVSRTPKAHVRNESGTGPSVTTPQTGGPPIQQQLALGPDAKLVEALETDGKMSSVNLPLHVATSTKRNHGPSSSQSVLHESEMPLTADTLQSMSVSETSHRSRYDGNDHGHLAVTTLSPAIPNKLPEDSHSRKQAEHTIRENHPSRVTAYQPPSNPVRNVLFQGDQQNPSAASNSQSNSSSITLSSSVNHSVTTNKPLPKSSSNQLQAPSPEEPDFQVAVDSSHSANASQVFMSSSKPSTRLSSSNFLPATSTVVANHTSSSNVTSQAPLSGPNPNPNPSHTSYPVPSAHSHVPSVLNHGVPNLLDPHITPPTAPSSMSKQQTASTGRPYETAKSSEPTYFGSASQAPRPLVAITETTPENQPSSKPSSSVLQNAKLAARAYHAPAVVTSPSPVHISQTEPPSYRHGSSTPQSTSFHPSAPGPQPPAVVSPVPLNLSQSHSLSHHYDPSTPRPSTSHESSIRHPPAPTPSQRLSPHHLHHASTPPPAISHQPSTRPHHQHSVSLPTNSPSALTHTSQSKSSRAPGYMSSRSSPMPAITTHAYVPADRQITATATRVPISGHMSTPAPSRAQQLPRPPSRESTLHTPSSLAQSIPQQPIQSRSASRASAHSQESTKRKGFLGGFFKSKTVPKDYEILHPSTELELDEGSERQFKIRSTKTTKNQSATKVSGSNSWPTTRKTPSPSKTPNSMLATHPVSIREPSVKHAGTSTSSTAVPTSAGSKILSPFRFLTSHKRHRTVSAASVEALDGTTTAPNTVIGSPTQSMLSQTPGLPPLQPPPVRDPMVAAQEWRNREEAELRARGSGKRRKPGVVFDVAEDKPKKYRHER